MPSYPSINDREFNLLKKIAENTAEISSGGGGGGSGLQLQSGATGSKLTDAEIVALSSMPLSTLVYLVDPSNPTISSKMTLADLFLLVNLSFDFGETLLGRVSGPTFIEGNSVSIRGAVSAVLNVDDDGVYNIRPMRPDTTVFETGFSTAIEFSSAVGEYIYPCTDSAPIDIFAPSLMEDAQIRITNISADPVVVNCAAVPVGAFLNGSLTPVNSCSIAPGQTVTLVSAYLNPPDDTFWVITGRTVAI